MGAVTDNKQLTRAISPLGRRGQPRRRRRSSGINERPNYLAGVLSSFWLLIIVIPVYVLVKSSFQSEAQFNNSGPLSVPKHLTLNDYHKVITSGFLRYFLNSGIVTAATILIVLALVPPAAYAMVRNRSRIVSAFFRVLLMGLAVPISVVMVPMYYMMLKAGLYDTLIAVILPTAAFSLPVCTIVLTGAMRDITPELYEAMALDGASSWRVFRNLVFPLSHGGIATIVVFAGLQAWNGFLFPLVLTISQSKEVFTMGLYQFQQQGSTDMPAITAAVVLSIIPILLIYLFGRRWLVQGMMGVGGK